MYWKNIINLLHLYYYYNIRALDSSIIINQNAVIYNIPC